MEAEVDISEGKVKPPARDCVEESRVRKYATQHTECKSKHAGCKDRRRGAEGEQNQGVGVGVGLSGCVYASEGRVTYAVGKM